MSGPWSNQVTSLIILTEQTTGFSGLFGYSPSAGAGNLIFSLAAKAGTDPYGNAYPQGLSTTLGSISGTTFNGTDFTINTSGEFFYSGTPALGNLVVSIAQAAGTDGFGNAYQAGITSYNGGISGNLNAGVLQFLAAASQFGPAQVTPVGEGILGLTSGQVGNTDNAAEIELLSASANSGTNEVAIVASQVQLNLSASETIPVTDASMNVQGAAPGAYSQSYAQATVTRVNALINDLIAAGIVTP